ncbi:hypothetical protein M9Y10_028472 [Tritrichomonas musculus]|uniref:Uncharacterized protein n=1 Tax=Tritrichomonas musculus TaxID=1915356 RepID=A0ABR2KJF5_9EUKA
MDACNIEPLLRIESRQRSDVSLIEKNLYENSLCFSFSGKKVSSAVKFDNEPHLITSKQYPDFSSCEFPNYQESSSCSLTSKAFNSTTFQCQSGTPKCSIDQNTTNLRNNTEIFNFPHIINNEDTQNCSSNNDNYNEVFSYNNTSNSSSCIKNDNIFKNNADEEDEFESVINPRSKQAPPERDTSSLSSPCPIYIQQFSLSSQSTNYDSFPHILSDSEMTTMMIPTFPLDLINACNYLSQDTEDSFASVIYNTPSQLQPVLTPAHSTLPQFYCDYNSISTNNYNYGFNSCCVTEIEKQDNIQVQSSSFSPVISNDQDKNYFHQFIQCENSYDNQMQTQNKSPFTNTTIPKHRQRISSNEYKRYRSPAILIVQSSTTSNSSGTDPQSSSTKSSGSALSPSSERRARTRKVSSSPSIGKPSRNNFSNSTDIDIDDKKPVINFQKPTISSSNNYEKINSQENKKCESIAKSKIRGRR